MNVVYGCNAIRFESEVQQQKRQKVKDIMARCVNELTTTQVTFMQVKKDIAKVMKILKALHVTKGPFSTSDNLILVLDHEYVLLTASSIVSFHGSMNVKIINHMMYYN